MAARPRTLKEVSRPPRWLFGPIPDLLFGCGVAYLIVFAGLAVAGPDVALWLPASILPLLTVVAGGPHYGATLLRAYERKEDRVKYRNVTVLATLGLALAFLLSLRLHRLGTWLVTLYLLWSPWHYSGQNYGLMLMFLGRRGIATPPPLKRLIRASFVLSFLIVIVQLNGENPSASYAPSIQATSGGPTGPLYTQLSLGIPTPVQSVLFFGLVVAYLATLGVAGVSLLRRGSIRDLLPALAIVATQSVWFSLPAIARQANLSFGLVPLDADFAVYTFHYIAAAHGIQYVWVTLYFHRKTHAGSRMSFFYGKSMLAGQLLWGLPALVFAPLMIGSLSYSADVALLVASTVNLHHFVIDGAIWRLRDDRVGKVLVREAPGVAVPIGAGGPRWLAALVFGAGAVFVVSQIVNAVEGHAFARSLERKEVAGAERALDHLGLFASDAYDLRIELGLLARETGDLPAAIRAFERSVALRPNPRAWYEKARVHVLRDEWELAASSFEAAYALAPFPPSYTAEFVEALTRAGRRERAIAVLNDGLRKFPQSPELGRVRDELALGSS
ncbi:MAG: tetratricopeptide repeat protein [Candidatus Limnocylindria bacterium]